MKVKKYIYVDIAPNLYVGTQFLKANFGKSVKDFTNYESQSTISFTKIRSNLLSKDKTIFCFSYQLSL